MGDSKVNLTKNSASNSIDDFSSEKSFVEIVNDKRHFRAKIHLNRFDSFDKDEIDVSLLSYIIYWTTNLMINFEFRSMYITTMSKFMQPKITQLILIVR